jgi:hypothetical protein
MVEFTYILHTVQHPHSANIDQQYTNRSVLMYSWFVGTLRKLT